VFAKEWHPDSALTWLMVRAVPDWALSPLNKLSNRLKLDNRDTAAFESQPLH